MKRLLKLVRPVVEVELRPVWPNGGVGESSSSDLPPSDPIVEERPRRFSRAGGAKEGDDLAERADVVESLRFSVCSLALTTDASAECEGDWPGWALPSVLERCTAVNGGL